MKEQLKHVKIFGANSSFNYFEIQKYYQMECRFNAVWLTDNLAKIKDRAYVVSLDEYESVGTHWIVLYVKGYLY